MYIADGQPPSRVTFNNSHLMSFLLCLPHSFTDVQCCPQSCWPEKKEKKEKKNYASSKKLLTSIKEKGPLGKKSPFTRKEKGGQ